MRWRLGAAGLGLLSACALGMAVASPPQTHRTRPFLDAAPQPSRAPDTMAQRLQACTPCHGRQGVATADGYFPRIAGKPEGYLFEQLLNFQQGRRTNATMRHLVQPLSTAYLQEIAAHFAALDLPYPPPEAHQATPAVLQRGRQLAVEGDPQLKLPACASCHGTTLTGVLPATPGLLGLSKDYLSAQLGAWRHGLRRARAPDCMKPLVQRLHEDDLHAVSAYLASQALPRLTQATPLTSEGLAQRQAAQSLLDCRPTPSP